MELNESEKLYLASRACDSECLDSKPNASVHRVYFICPPHPQIPQIAVLKRQKEPKGRKEAEIYRLIRNLSPNILVMYFHIIYRRESCLFLENAESDLSQFIKNRRTTDSTMFVPGNALIQMFKELVSAVKILHDHDIAHRDIKPKNIFLVNGILKLGDFGISKVIQRTESMHSAKGTLRYMAPELRESYILSSRTEYPFKNDIWALGITMMELALLEEVNDPIQGANDMGKHDYNPELIKIIQGALNPEPSERPSIEEMHRQLIDYEVNNSETEVLYHPCLFVCKRCESQICDFFITTPCLHKFHFKCFREFIEEKMKYSYNINCLECSTPLIGKIPFLLSLSPSRKCIKKIILIHVRKKFFVCKDCGKEDKMYRRVDEKLNSFLIHCKSCGETYCSLCRTSLGSHDFGNVVSEVISEFI